MSSGAQVNRAELLAELARELRLLNGLSAAGFRAMAARIGVTATDMQVIESLLSDGPMSAGQLADLTGLTTGAITGMINRLEEAGLVRRETDPEDRRRVIVRLSPDREQIRAIGPVFEIVGKAWEELTSTYTDEQIAFLVEFFKRGNAVARQEIAWLREAPKGEAGIWSAPLGDLTSGQLVVSGSARLTLRAGQGMVELYQARFEGPVPEVKTTDGAVTIRYPRRLWMLSAGQRSAEIALSDAIPWRISIQGGGSEITAELDGLDLAALEIKGGGSMIRVELPAPSGAVPIRISGGGSAIVVRRPAGVPAKVRLKGWGSGFVFDGQTVYDVGNDVRMQSPSYNTSELHYDIEVASSGGMITISAG